MKFTKFAFAAALCAMFVVQAEARTLYVDARRPNNRGNGLKLATAKKTIQAAINIAKPGDVIVVAPGSYAPIKTNNKKVRIVSLKGVSKTKIIKPAAVDKKVALAQLGKSYNVYIGTDAKGNWQKGSSGIWTKGAASTLEGFLLDGMNRAVGSFGELIGVSGGTVKSCRIQRLGKRYADTFGGFASYDRAYVAVNSSLTACMVQNNKVYGIAPAERGAVGSGNKAVAATGSKFTRCAIRNNEGYDGLDKADLFSCLLYGNTPRYELFGNSTLVNCTVAKNTVKSRSETPEFSVKSKYYNCILWNNYVTPPKVQVYSYDYYDADGNWIGCREADATTFSIEYTDALGEPTSANGVTEGTLSNFCPGWTKSSNSDYVPGTSMRLHNVDSGNTYKYTDKTNKNPKFVGASKNNYKLKKGSYAIDAGRLNRTQMKQLGTKDLAGGKRVKGKYVDRGCYEY